MSTGAVLRCLAAAALSACPSPASAEDRMTGDAIRQTFSGAALDGVYADGSFFTEEYRGDGSISYHDAENADSGEWSVRNETFCTFYSGRDGACFIVVRQSQNCFAFYEEKPGSGGGNAPRAEWTSQGWLRSRPSTCTVPADQTI